MKKLLLATAVSALAINAVQAAPTVYGKLHVTLDNVDKFSATTKADTDNVWEINSNASRIGIKGEETLTDYLKAIYLAEWAVSTDGAGSDVDLNSRNRYLGLKYDNIGTVKVGKFDSYLKTAQGKVDMFNDLTYLDITKIMAGENRLDNVIGFESDPKALNGFGINVLLQQGEGKKLGSDVTTTTNGTSVTKNNSNDTADSIGDAISASLVYDNKDMGVYAALAGDKNVVSNFAAVGNSGAKAEAKIIRVAGMLDLGEMASISGLSLNALYQTAEPTDLAPVATMVNPILRDLDQENSFLISAAYKVGETPWAIKLQYHQSETDFKTATNEDATLSQIGGMVDYMFNSKTRAYGYVAEQSDDRKNVDDRMYAGVGMEFNF